MSKLPVFEGHPRRVSIGHCPSDIFPAALASMRCTDSIGVHLLSIHRERYFRRVKRFVSRLYRLSIRMLRGSASPDTIVSTVRAPAHGCQLLSFAAFEAFRFSGIVAQLRAASPGNVVYVGWAGYSGNAIHQVSRRLNVLAAMVPVFSQSESDRVSLSAERAFVSTLLGIGVKEPQCLYFQMRHYARGRLPRLVGAYRGWKRVIRETSPSSVIVSSLGNLESQLPAIAARESGVRSFSIPHGGVCLVDFQQQADVICCPNIPQALAWRDAGYDGKKVMLCRNIVAEHEYPHASASARRDLECSYDEVADRELSIVILTSAMTPYVNRILPSLSIRGNAQTAQLLWAIPSDLLDIIKLKLKPHPGVPETELFSKNAQSSQIEIVAKDVNLRVILEEADIVVAKNYVGTALIHAVQLCKPVILLWPDLILGEDGRDQLSPIAYYWRDCGMLVRDREAFWPLIRKMTVNKDELLRVAEHTASWGKKNLDDSDLPAITDVINGSAECCEAGRERCTALEAIE